MVTKKFLVAERTRFENFDARSSKKELLELLSSKQKEPIFAIQHTKSSKRELFQPKGTWNLLTEILTKSSMICPPPWRTIFSNGGKVLCFAQKFYLRTFALSKSAKVWKRTFRKKKFLRSQVLFAPSKSAKVRQKNFWSTFFFPTVQSSQSAQFPHPYTC